MSFIDEGLESARYLIIDPLVEPMTEVRPSRTVLPRIRITPV
jgi:hypothetical protein